MPAGVICQKRLGNRRDRKLGLEIRNEVPHRPLEDAEAVCLGLLQGFLVLPMVVADPVARQDGPSAIRPAPAVDEHRPAVAVLQNAQSLGNLLVAGRAQTFHGNADKAHPIRLDHFLLVRNRMLIDPPQIHDRLDAPLGQLFEAVVGGLASAKNVIVDDFEIRETAGTLGE